MVHSYRVLTAALVLCVMLAGELSAQRLLETDGIELLGEAQLVMSGGGTCNVLESDTAYERIKANHGQPMDIWRLDFSVRNGSGRWLDHLIARFQIESEWPDCTNWDGPDAGTFQPLEWADSIGHIQESGRNVVSPGQTLTETRYFIVLQGDPPPQFANWSMDFDFAVNPPPADSQSDAPGSPSAAAAAGLPPEIQVDRYLLQAEQAVHDGDAASARAAMERLGALEREHGLEPEPEDYYRYAQAWEAAGEPQRAVEAAVRYLQLRGREAEHYEEALHLMNRAESGPAVPGTRAGGSATRAEESGQAFQPEPEATCAGKEGGTACWMELSSHPGCYVWAFRFYPRPLTWSAECSGGLASGTGTLTWVREGWDIKESGLLRNGKKHGTWTEDEDEGPYVDGKREGKWTLRWRNEDVGEAWYVNGKRHGRYVTRYPDGSGEEGMYVDGERHGRWIGYTGNKEPGGGVYEHGTKQGEWVDHIGEYKTIRGPYVDGEKHGEWVERWESPDQLTVERGPYVNGTKHGRWVDRNNDFVSEGEYVNGRRQGHWVARNEKDGTIEEGSYFHGRVGRWVTRRADGTVVEVEEWRQVEERQPDGSVWKGTYVNGKKHGGWDREGADGDRLENEFYWMGELRSRKVY